jgi:hypothetical protein
VSEPDDNDPPNLNTGKPWSDMDLLDFGNAVATGQSVEQIADFLCRTRQEVRDKARALGIVLVEWGGS